MANIKAVGRIAEEILAVECVERGGVITVTFNGRQDKFLKQFLDSRLDIAPAMGGTYYPETLDMLAYYNILNTVFFDELQSLETEGNIGSIPYEDGVIY